MPTRRSTLALSLGGAIAALTGHGGAADLRLDLPVVFAVDGIALGGADPVAYFNLGAMRKGRPDLAMIWRGAEWRFASAANLATFQLNPTVFAPRYGGYCAWSLAQGLLRPSSPEVWLIEDSRLFLFEALPLREQWRAALPGIVADADRKWPVLLG